MAKWVCSVCGYVYEGETAPEQCPQCKAPAEKFVKQEGEMTWASEHVVGVAHDVPADIRADLEANFIAKAIQNSASTGKRLLGKKLNTLRNSLNSSATLSPTAPRRTLKCA